MATGFTKTLVGSGEHTRLIALADVSGTTVNAETSIIEVNMQPYSTFAVNIRNTDGANGLTYSIDGDNQSDFSTETQIQSANVAAGAWSASYVAPGNTAEKIGGIQYRYFRVTVKSQVADSHATYDAYVTAKR